MNPDVVGAVARLRADGVLSEPQATLCDRVARRALVSVRFEIRALLYLGVLLLTSGVGLLVAEHHRRIGPVAVAGGLALAAAACLAWVMRIAPAFSWEAVPAPRVAFDYVLLLGLMLLAADLAYVETQLALLGARWPYHLLVVGAIYLLAAYRWDSRVVLALALTTLAAWRGLAIGAGPRAAADGEEDVLRANALVLGGLYVAAAALAVRWRRKAHFEAVYANTGLLLVLGALVSGALDDAAWPAWLAALLVVAGLVMALAFRLRRSVYFAGAVVAAYVGVVRLLFDRAGAWAGGRALPFLLAALLGAGALVLVAAAHRRMREE